MCHHLKQQSSNYSRKRVGTCFIAVWSMVLRLTAWVSDSWIEDELSMVIIDQFLLTWDSLDYRFMDGGWTHRVAWIYWATTCDQSSRNLDRFWGHKGNRSRHVHAVESGRGHRSAKDAPASTRFVSSNSADGLFTVVFVAMVVEEDMTVTTAQQQQAEQMRVFWKVSAIIVLDVYIPINDLLSSSRECCGTLVLFLSTESNKCSNLRPVMTVLLSNLASSWRQPNGKDLSQSRMGCGSWHSIRSAQM